MHYRWEFSTKGQSLIETVVALAVALIIMTGITNTAVTALSNAQYSKNQTLAAGYTREGLEIMKNIRNTNITKFNGYPSAGDSKGWLTLPKNAKEPDQSTELQGDCSTPTIANYTCAVAEMIDTVFCRKVCVDRGNTLQCDSDGRFVRVDVRWGDGKCPTNDQFCHASTLQTCLSDALLTPGP